MTARKRKTRRIQTAIAAAFVVVAAAAGFLVYRVSHGQEAEEVSYTTATVQRMTLTSSVSGTGNVELAEFAAVRPEVSGTVSGLCVQVGDQVEAGQLLFTIVNPELDLAVTKAEIAYQEAVLNLAKAELSVLQAKENLSELLEQYEAQSTTTTASTSTTGPVPTATPPPTTATTSPVPTTTTTVTVPETTVTVPETTVTAPDSTTTLGADSALRVTLSPSVTDAISPSVTDAITNTLVLLAASSSATPSGTASSVSGSAQGSGSGEKITYLDIKAARQAVESAELAVSSAQVQVTSAELALDQARESAAKREVRAPISGIVTELNVKNGDSVGTGGSSGAVMTITNPNAFTVTVSLSETDIPSVKIGQKATITFDALADLTLTGKVTAIDLVGSNNQGVVSYGVVISPDVTDPSIKAGMTATVNIITQVAADVLAVPLAAVKSQGDVKYVQVLENGIPTAVTVEVGMTTDSYAEITSGLQEGQEVVVRTVVNGTSASTSTTGNRGSFFDGGGAGDLLPGVAPGAAPGGAIPGGAVPGVR
ncbi:MAG: efflux RND transporter periplasmic adaptor subunit [Thermoleophilia bacterium]|nr:efflux RND transporter periplasmic adaptor subunit [Thermoleophilia bacterium]